MFQYRQKVDKKARLVFEKGIIRTFCCHGECNKVKKYYLTTNELGAILHL